MTRNSLVIDIGGCTLKLGLSTSNTPNIIDNCIYKSNKSNRSFIGFEIEDCNNFSSLRGTFPFKKGYLSNWDVQKQILDNVLSRFFNSLNFEICDVNLIVTEPYFNFNSTKETINEIFYEDYRVNGLIRANPAFLAAYKYKSEATQRISRNCVVVDSGYSFSHIVPLSDGKILKECCLRLSVGGKILTNRLIEVTSYRQLDVRNEVYIMNQCKEDACFVSQNFKTDLLLARSARGSSSKTLLREYVLPDYLDFYRGYLKNPTEVSFDGSSKAKPKPSGNTLHLGNERFTIPELLFNPSDVGYSEMGIGEAINYVISETIPPTVRPSLWNNCIVMGGNAKFEGFSQRLFNEMRAGAPNDLPVNVFTPERPQEYAWQGGALLSTQTDDFHRFLVTRKEYEENGHAYCESKFPVT